MAADSKAVPALQRRPRTPWSFHVFRVTPWSAAVTGIAIGAVLVAALVFFEMLSGRPQLLLRGVSPIDAGCVYLLGDYRISLVGVILLAYTATARYVLAQWSHESAARLSVANYCDADTLAEQRWWGFLPGVLGALLTFMFGVDISERPIEATSSYWILPHFFNWAWCLPFGWVAGRLFYAVPTNAIMIGRIAKGIEIEDLAHREPLDVAIQHGSRSAFLSVIFLGLVSVHFVDPGTGAIAATVLSILFFAGVAISSVPVVGAIARLQDTRDAQVERLQSERAEEEAKMLRNDGSYQPGRMADLVALEQHLVDQRITIFRVSNLVRLLIYAVIGLLSWMGAAAVSVFVESLFGV